MVEKLFTTMSPPLFVNTLFRFTAYPRGMSYPTPTSSRPGAPEARLMSPCMSLVLQLDGDDWEVHFSAGIERFIGVYPRLPELRSAEPMFLKYYEVHGRRK